MKKALLVLTSGSLISLFAHSTSACQTKIASTTADNFISEYFPQADIPGPIHGTFSYIDSTGYPQQGTADCFVPAMGSASDGVVSTCAVTMKSAINCKALLNDVNNQMFGHWASSDIKLTGFKSGHVLAGENDFTVARWDIVNFVQCEKAAGHDAHLFFVGDLAKNVINSVYACDSDDINLSNCAKPILTCK